MYNFSVFKECNEIDEVAEIWSEIYRENNELTPYQSYEWNKIIIDNRMYKGNLNCILLTKGNKPVLLAPLIYRKKTLYNEISFLGENTHSDYLNFIYDKSLEFEDFKYFINKVFKIYRCCVFKFNCINESSRICDFFGRLDVIKKCTSSICVRIPICKSEEEYFNSLSKNTRSMLRARQNKINKIADRIKFNFYAGEKLPAELTSKIIKLYCARQKSRYHNDIGERYVKYLFQAVRESENIFLGICNIDNNLAACHLGLISLNNDICNMIVAINSEYEEYGFGNLLLLRLIGYLIQSNSKSNGLESSCCYYDLTRGDDSYKYKFGGINHLNYHYTLWKNNIVLRIQSVSNRTGTTLAGFIHRLKNIFAT